MKKWHFLLALTVSLMIGLSALVSLIAPSPVLATNKCAITAVTQTGDTIKIYVDVTDYYNAGEKDTVISTLFGQGDGLASSTVADAKIIDHKYYDIFDINAVDGEKTIGDGWPVYVYTGHWVGWGNITPDTSCKYSAQVDDWQSKDSSHPDDQTLGGMKAATVNQIPQGTPEAPPAQVLAEEDNTDNASCSATGTVVADNVIVITAQSNSFTGDMEQDKVIAYATPNGSISSEVTDGVRSVYNQATKRWSFTFPAWNEYDPTQGLDYSVTFHGRNYCDVTPPTNDSGENEDDGEDNGDDSDDDSGGIGTIGSSEDGPEDVDPCRNAIRMAECQADPSSYHNNVCFSPLSRDSANLAREDNPLDSFRYAGTLDKAGNPVYDSIDCQSQRGIDACKKQGGGRTYLRAFGIDPENSCVTFIGFTKTIINYAFIVAALIAGAMLLKGGFKYTVSRGSATALMEARDEILYASIGIVMLAIAYVAVLFLQGSLGFLGVDLVGPFAAVFGS